MQQGNLLPKAMCGALLRGRKKLAKHFNIERQSLGNCWRLLWLPFRSFVVSRAFLQKSARVANSMAFWDAICTNGTMSSYCRHANGKFSSQILFGLYHVLLGTMPDISPHVLGDSGNWISVPEYYFLNNTRDNLHAQIDNTNANILILYLG